MITSSNFFNKTIFLGDQEIHNDSNEVGPWFIKQRKFATLDVQRKNRNKSQIRYNNTKSDPYHYRHSSRISTKLTPKQLNFDIDNNPYDINEKAKIQRQKNKIQSLLPQIHKISKTAVKKGNVNQYSKQFCSPLAYELNFIIKKHQKPNKNKKYLPQYLHSSITTNQKVVQKLLNHQNSKYNIYQKCVIQIKRNQTKTSRQLSKELSKQFTRS